MSPASPYSYAVFCVYALRADKNAFFFFYFYFFYCCLQQFSLLESKEN